MKSKSAFEERLISYSSEATLKAAKQLLKAKAVQGAFRDEAGRIHGVFVEKNRTSKVVLEQSDPPRFECDCPGGSAAGSEGELCEHAIALWMYAGLFRLPETGGEVDGESANYTGLKNAGLTALAKESTVTAAAQLFIYAESAFPHVPSKWENAVLCVRLRSGSREYLGNLNNLRQLYFDKILTAALRITDFSLLDRQLIRFLAINGEADSSNILLNSEATSELFHAMGNFERFFRNNCRLIIHTEANAEAVIIARTGKQGSEYSPGICFGQAYLPIHSAKVITGRTGCWIGKSGEYFWIPADYEIGFMRNFFRLGVWQDNTPGSGDFMKTSPFRLVKLSGREPAQKKAIPWVDGTLSGGKFSGELRFVYDQTAFAPDAGRLVAGGDQRFWRRDEALEAEVVNTLKMLQASGELSRGKFELDNTEAVGMWLDEVLPDWLKRYPKLLLGGTLSKLANGGNQLTNLQLACSCDGQLNERGNFQINYRWHDTCGGEIAFHDLMEAAKQGARFVQLDNRRMVKLPAEAGRCVVKLYGFIQKLDEEQRYFEVPRLMLNFFQFLVKDFPGALPEALSGSLNVDSAPMAVFNPPPLKVTLRGYQQSGVEWMRRMMANDFNVILADEMGLGKTIQALAAFNSLRTPGMAPALVIAPASLVENWQRECQKFLTDCKVGVLYGSGREAVWKKLDEYELLIISYTLARREQSKLARKVFSLIILDEAQHIKNPGTANAQSCKALKAKHKLVLTGTPLENSPDDLWSIFDFLHPGILGSFNAFKKQYASISESKELQSELSARVAPFIKRRNKIDVAPELPPREDCLAYCTMEETQQKLYDEVLTEGRALLSKLEKSPKKAARGSMEILTTLLRLRQICCHPRLVSEDFSEVPSAKFELLQELILEHIDSNHKMLIFSQFTSLLAVIKEYLDNNHIRYSYLDGATKSRQAVVDEFNNTPEIPIFLLSLKAGGVGLNLTSADTVMIYDPWWNPAVELQAADRTHRIGQTKPVRILKLLVNGSIEEKILELQDRKQNLFDQIVDNPALAAEKLTIDDLKYLLNG